MKTLSRSVSRFSLLSNLEFRTKDDVSRMDRLGLAIGGEYRAYSFLKLEAGYETHFRNLGDSEWKFRHRYNFGATASFQYQWLKIVLRERFQQTFDRGDSKARLRSRLKLAYAPEKGIVSPYFSIEIYQSLDDAPFWRADRMRYRPGVFSLGGWSLRLPARFLVSRGTLDPAAACCFHVRGFHPLWPAFPGSSINRSAHLCSP